MAGIPSMAFSSLAIALLVANCAAYPGPAPAPAPAPTGATSRLDPSAPVAPRSKADAGDLEGSATFGLGYYGYGYGYPLSYASYYYPRYSAYYRPYRYYSYRHPYRYLDDYHRYSYYSYW